MDNIMFYNTEHKNYNFEDYSHAVDKRRDTFTLYEGIKKDPKLWMRALYMCWGRLITLHDMPDNHYDISSRIVELLCEYEAIVQLNWKNRQFDDWELPHFLHGNCAWEDVCIDI